MLVATLIRCSVIRLSMPCRDADADAYARPLCRVSRFYFRHTNAAFILRAISLRCRRHLRHAYTPLLPRYTLSLLMLAAAAIFRASIADAADDISLLPLFFCRYSARSCCRHAFAFRHAAAFSRFRR